MTCTHLETAVVATVLGKWLWVWCRHCRRDIAWYNQAGIAVESFADA